MRKYINYAVAFYVTSFSMWTVASDFTSFSNNPQIAADQLVEIVGPVVDRFSTPGTGDPFFINVVEWAEGACLKEKREKFEDCRSVSVLSAYWPAAYCLNSAPLSSKLENISDQQLLRCLNQQKHHEENIKTLIQSGHVTTQSYSKCTLSNIVYLDYKAAREFYSAIDEGFQKSGIRMKPILIGMLNTKVTNKEAVYNCLVEEVYGS